MNEGSRSYTEIPVVLRPSASYLAIHLPTDTSKLATQEELASSGLHIEQHASSDSNEATLFGGFCQISAKDSLLRTIGYRIPESKRSISLTPLLFNNSLDLQLQNIIFTLSVAIRDSSVTVIENSAKGDSIIVDIITETNLVISLSIDLKAFLTNASPMLQVSNFREWSSYSVPYFFNRRKPLFLKPLDSLNSIVGLVDGGLLLLTRDSPLNEFVVTPLSDVSYFENLKSKFFSQKSATSIPDEIEIQSQKVSTRSVLDAVTIGKNILLTLSIGKLLKVWSVDTGKNIYSYDLSELLPESLGPVLISRCLPKQLFHVLDDDLFALFLPIGSNYLKIFRLKADGSVSQLKDLESPLPSANWLFHSFDAKLEDSKVAVWISWCFGNNTLLQKCEIAQDGTAVWNECLNASEARAVDDRDFHRKIQNATNPESLSRLGLRHTLDALQYDSSMLKSAVALFNRNYGFALSELSLKEKILRLVDQNLDPQSADYLSNLKKQWVRFDNVCSEVAKSTQGIVSVSYDRSIEEDDGFFWLMKTHNYSLVKRSSISDILSSGTSVIPESLDKLLQIEGIDFVSLKSLVELLNAFRQGFSSGGILKIEQNIYDSSPSQPTEKLMSAIFEGVIAGNIDSSTIGQLLQSLNSTPNCLEGMQFLTNLTTLNPLDYLPVKGVLMGNAGDGLISSNIRTEAILAKNILLELLLIVLTVDISEPMVKLFEKASTLLKRFDLILVGLNLTLDSERKQLADYGQPSNSLVMSYLKQFYEGGALVGNRNLNLLTNDVFGKLTSSEFGYFVVSSLLSCDADVGLISGLLPDLEPRTPITLMLTGLVHLKAKDSSAYEAFHQSADSICKEGERHISRVERIAIEPISSTANLLLVDSKVEYFYNLSLLFESAGLESVALKFSLDALSTKNDLHDDSDDTVILAKIFQLSLKLNEFKLSYDTILMMSPKNRKHPIKQFIYKLFHRNQLSKILEFQFTQDFDTVDDLIYDLGESSALSGDLTNALKYYRTCYSLRLKEGDFRAAVESLYRFNCIGFQLVNLHRYNNVKLLLDNYLIVFNLLHTLKDEDRWVLKRPVHLQAESSEGMEVDAGESLQGDKFVTLSELEQEYNQLNAKYGDGVIV
ncbi:DEKNAAC104526 [Brettanomyces naardenensis]|uniref:DEKNAAC104526 n=1 Tax=Brettanomyces naardenensis TaxID=13370 RepID=A0A448YR45_BRENA|nr:DEKNAAC104526 [Brettanomyces naardenensis]